MRKSTKKDCPYELIEQLGYGGNAEVYLIQNKQHGKHAVKILNQNCRGYCLAERRARFRNEIEVISKNCIDIPGVMPIYESSIRGCWYTMPIAIPIMQHIHDNHSSVKDIVIGVAQLAETLMKLHSKQLSHRDIKPANIYYYCDRYYLGDFGLVDIPDNTGDFTRSDKALGAVFTMAPEMRRDPKHADGKKADVYSLAKSLWMLLTGNELGFDGPYDYNDRSLSLNVLLSHRDAYFVEIDELLMKATDNKPENRPDMETFINLLLQWLEVYGDKEKMDFRRWSFMNRLLFGECVPRTAVWENTEDIIRVLNTIPIANSYSHMLFSSKGGMDFLVAEPAHESGCISITDTAHAVIVAKPKELYYERFDDSPEWNYFLLEFDNLQYILDENETEEYEYLVEDVPGHYVSAKGYPYGVYDYDSGEKLPQGSRTVERYVKGKILFVLKTGPYNDISSTYDGRHGAFLPQSFRMYTMELHKQYLKLLERSGGNKELALQVLSLATAKHASVDPESPDSEDNSDEVKKLFLSSFTKWDLSPAIVPDESVAAIRFYISLHTGGMVGTLTKENQYLFCEDGHFHRVTEEKNPIYFSDRNVIVKVYEEVKKLLIKNTPYECEFFESLGIACGFGIDIKSEKCGSPSHLFTQEEMYGVMRDADDRIPHTMAIDEDGFVKLVPYLKYRRLYPVTFDLFEAGHNCVGKYADLSGVQDYYKTALYFWLRYLDSGRCQHADVDISTKTVEELIDEIQKQYEEKL